MSPQVTADDLEWWRSKFVRGAQNHRHGGPRGFGAIAAGHAIHLLDRLTRASPSYRLVAPTIAEFSQLVDLASKFVPRAVAMLTRSGLVQAELVPSLSITLMPERLRQRKNAAQAPSRRRLSPKAREEVLRRDLFKCGHCKHRFTSPELEVGHIVPVCLLGADSPANWVALCHKDNAQAWDGFDPAFLRLYRGRRVLRRTGVRFRHGLFWPVVNGIARIDRVTS
jgi:hypothetical protein